MEDLGTTGRRDLGVAEEFGIETFRAGE